MDDASAQGSVRVESLNAPVYPGAPVLIVRDLAGVARYYEEGIGLSRIDADSETVRLGAGGVALVVLRKRQSAEQGRPAWRAFIIRPFWCRAVVNSAIGCAAPSRQNFLSTVLRTTW